MKEMVGGCCVCSDERGWAENPLVYCDGQGCTVAVHQACYGIVSVPQGNWYCRKCESQERSARVRCELCPCKDGALKKTDNSGWAHVVCALYIPEVRFGNVTTMEPILLHQIPPERFNKTCYICEENGKGSKATNGACMQCNKAGCRQQFHVTCAQAMGLLCEEAGNYLDNVKYCGYCQHHYSKLKKGGNVKPIPPYRPVPSTNPLDSSPEKETIDKSVPKRKTSSTTKSGGPVITSTDKPGVLKLSISTKGSSVEINSAAEESSTLSAQPAAIPTSTSSSVKSELSDKFTTLNFVESIVAPSESVFGDSKNKKRKGGARTPPNSAPKDSEVSPSDEKDAKKMLDINATEQGGDANAPSVVVKAEGAYPSPSSAAPLTPGSGFSSPAVSKASSTNSATPTTNSIVVSVPYSTAAPAIASTNAAAHGSDMSPAKRSRSQSNEKSEKGKKKRHSVSGSTSPAGGKKSLAGSRTSSPTPDTNAAPKDSPPSSPEISNKKGNNSTTKGRRGSMSLSQPQPQPQAQPVKDEKETKLFQNGVVNAPHMLGNQLNPSSMMAQKMTDTLNAELEAHSIYRAEPNASLVGPQLYSRVISEARSGRSTPNANLSTSTTVTTAATTTTSTASSNGAVSWSSLGGGNIPQTLDQLLERQWEHGSQFLMEQAQHFDIASLLSCLHQLRAENLRLEEHVNSLVQRRDHLLAVNARLAIPLTPVTQVNNVHPATVQQVNESRTSAIHSVGAQQRINNVYSQPPPMENGLSASPPTMYQHRNPHQQPPQSSPNIRHHNSPAVYATVHPTITTPGVVRTSADPMSRPDARRSVPSNANMAASGSSIQSGGYSTAMYSMPTSQQQVRTSYEPNLSH
nr:PREDICTED: protein AF-10-like isoform X2 [Bemisia tabaci]